MSRADPSAFYKIQISWTPNHDSPDVQTLIEHYTNWVIPFTIFPYCSFDCYPNNFHPPTVQGQDRAVSNFIYMYTHTHTHTFVIRVCSRFNIIVFLTVRGSLGRKQRANKYTGFIFRNTVWSAKWAPAFQRCLQDTLKIGALLVAETLMGLPTYQTVRCHNPEH